MTPEDEQIICGIKKFLQAGAIQHGLDEITDLMRIIDDLRRELHRYQAAAEEEARAVDEQVATSDEHREQSQAWERRAKYFERQIANVAGVLGFAIADADGIERQAFAHAASHLDLIVLRANEKAPEPKEREA